MVDPANLTPAQVRLSTGQTGKGNANGAGAGGIAVGDMGGGMKIRL